LLFKRVRAICPNRFGHCNTIARSGLRPSFRSTPLATFSLPPATRVPHHTDSTANLAVQKTHYRATMSDEELPMNFADRGSQAPGCVACGSSQSWTQSVGVVCSDAVTIFLLMIYVAHHNPPSRLRRCSEACPTVRSPDMG
jgi:hypothetical protein